MQISPIDKHTIDWNRKGKFSEVYSTIKELPIGEAISIKLDNPSNIFGGKMQTYFRQSKFKFRLITRKGDKSGKLWYIMKVGLVR